MNFGQALAIGKFDNKNYAGKIGNNTPDIMGDEDSGTLVVGMPGHNGKRGALGMFHWQGHFCGSSAGGLSNCTGKGTSSSPFAGVPVVPLTFGSDHETTVKADWGTPTVLAGYLAYNSWAADAEEFGHSLAVGMFRDPNLGVVGSTAPGNFGFDEFNLKPINQVLVAGAPGYNSGTGAIYAFTGDQFYLGHDKDGGEQLNVSYQRKSAWVDVSDVTGATFVDALDMDPSESPTYNASRLSSTHSNTSLCDTQSECRTAIRITNPISNHKNRFGVTVSAIAVPVETKTCISPSPYCNDNKKYWANLSDQIDTLAVGTSGSSLAQQTAYTFANLVSSGIANAPQRYTGSRLHTSSGFGASVAGGFFKGRSENFSVLVGAPNLDDPIEQTGNVYFFPRLPDGSLTILNPVDMAYQIPRPDGADRAFNISHLNNLNFYRAKPVGDLNCDGYTDVVFPLYYDHDSTSGAANLLVIYGSPDGLIYSPIPDDVNTIRSQNDSRAPQWLNIKKFAGSSSTVDEQAALNFMGIGNINGDRLAGRNCDDLMIKFKKTYVFYGSAAGLIIQAPQLSDSISDNATQEIQTIFNYGKDTSVNRFVSSIPDATTATCTASDQAGGGGTEACADQADDPLYDLTGDSGTTARDAYGSQTSGPAPINERSLGYSNVRVTGDLAPTADIIPRQTPICHGDFNDDGYVDTVVGGSQELYYRTFVNYKNGTTNNHTIASTNEFYGNSFLEVTYGSANGLRTGNTYPAEADHQTTCSGGVCTPGRLYHPGQYWAPPSMATVFYPYNGWREHHIRRSAQNTDHNVHPQANILRDRFGESCISVGNVLGSEYSDLVVPLPHQKSAGAGKSFIIYRGSANGLQATEASFVELEATSNFSDFGSYFNGTTELGWAAAGLGDLNGDKVNEFALSLKNDNGKVGFVIVFGDSEMTPAPSGSITNYKDKFQVGNDSGGASYLNHLKLKIRKLTPNSLTDAECQTLTSCAIFIPGPDDAGPYFAQSLFGAGDINSDGFADVIVGDSTYDYPGIANIGRTYVFFGDGEKGIHYSDRPSDKARCLGEAEQRNCTPLAITPKFTYQYDSFLTNDAWTSNQYWRPSSYVIFKSLETLSSSAIGDWANVNFGSRAGENSVDTSSADILICNRDNFKHQDSDSKDLGLCSLYY